MGMGGNVTEKPSPHTSTRKVLHSLCTCVCV